MTGNDTVVVLSGNYITFDGFEVTNAGSGNNLGIYVTGSYQNITRNTIHNIESDCGVDGGGGIQLASNITNVTMDSNSVYDISWTSCAGRPSVNYEDGIIAETDGPGITITNNIIYHVAGGGGILVGAGGSGAVTDLVANNTVFSNSNRGIVYWHSGGSITMANNIVVYNRTSSSGCGFDDAYGPATYATNDLYNNPGGNYCVNFGSSDSSIRAGDIAVNPALGTTFVNWQADGSGNYHLFAGSPAIGAGTALSGVTHDFDGNPRLGPNGYSMGAYEYQ